MSCSSPCSYRYIAGNVSLRDLGRDRERRFAPDVPLASTRVGCELPRRPECRPRGSRVRRAAAARDTDRDPGGRRRRARPPEPGRDRHRRRHRRGLERGADAARAPTGRPSRRIAGTDRYDTSRTIVADAFDVTEVVWVATGANFPDALAARPRPPPTGLPVLIVPGTAPRIDAATMAALAALNPRSWPSRAAPASSARESDRRSRSRLGLACSALRRRHPLRHRVAINSVRLGPREPRSVYACW